MASGRNETRWPDVYLAAAKGFSSCGWTVAGCWSRPAGLLAGAWLFARVAQRARDDAALVRGVLLLLGAICATFPLVSVFRATRAGPAGAGLATSGPSTQRIPVAPDTVGS